ncbi:aminotransferase class V-fold PLP-dependent enzyme [Thalassotalea profundi]|uniref:Probable cysteine desulfurase n=1 Tax=Thalassotalea profundi TaxID=2036687 RepID=A0ABQ3ITJ6_9GAMM|nr:aminotransferase class V-fold PLP-dependent enzyme [Thalassotalea profundi]GHE92206.1 cysteine desulfurase [Thalassotalea profundi]
MSIVSPWKQDFPVFNADAYPNLCYLDSAATCLTPKRVADAMYNYQCYSHANSHKGLYYLSANVTEKVEYARTRIAEFLGASSLNEIVFTSGTTESLNLVAYSYIETKITSKSNIIISAAEHHANLLPWQRLCQQYGASLRVAPLNDHGIIDFSQLVTLIDSDTLLIAISQSANVIGKFNPIKQICQYARQNNIITVIDGAQAVSHGNINVDDLECDFYAFSGHKLYGPTGCGVLYCRMGLIEQMRPYQVGGGIIDNVSYQSSHYLTGPLKFESGSHNVVSIIGLLAALDYLNDISWQAINAYLERLSGYMQKRLAELNFIHPIVRSGDSAPYLYSFQMNKVHCHDVASMLDIEGIAVRAGHHCAQPLHKTLGINASVRVSLGLYNDHTDIDRLITGLTNTYQLLKIE